MVFYIILLEFGLPTGNQELKSAGLPTGDQTGLRTTLWCWTAKSVALGSGGAGQQKLWPRFLLEGFLQGGYGEEYDRELTSPGAETSKG